MRILVRNRVFLLSDLLAWILIPVVALALRLDGFTQLDQYAAALTGFAAIAIVCKFLTFWLGGLYRRYWMYASIDELGLITVATFAAGFTASMAYWFLIAPLLHPSPQLPRSVPILDLVLTLLHAGGTRFAVRYYEHSRSRWRGGREPRTRVLIAGAGHAGRLVARELQTSEHLQVLPIGFVDDDPSKYGSKIQGLPVLGDRSRLAAVATDYGVDEVIIAMPTAPGAVVREIIAICERADLRARTIPGMFELISGRVSVTHLRDVQIEDLLRRPPVETDQRSVAQQVSGKTVLVTGAGGSIGSEICRQVALLGAREVILLGHGENSIFDIHCELVAKYPSLNIVPVIGDIRDAARVKKVFDTYRPQLVLHAAAHKHVPLMELNPGEAVTNNVNGTRNLVEMSERAGVERFLLISTDKAVNPVNVMGATKLLAEMIVHDAALRTGRPYVSVRFGNVLGSRGSVVPLFKRQIESGGPVTVTHPDMCRYFMTIPEAVQLVLQAAALGNGGETFVLDMGQPVKILDLAKDLIHLSGLEAGGDIDIVFSGLRPGEKLYEELFSPAETFGRTDHQKIFMVRNGQAPEVPHKAIDELVEAAKAGDDLRIRRKLSEIVPAYPHAARRPGVEAGPGTTGEAIPPAAEA